MLWGVEHTAMALIAVVLALWLAYHKNFLWLGSVILAQIPFWGGWMAYELSGDATPSMVNLGLDMMVAGLFLDRAYSEVMKGSGGFIQFALCGLFVVAGMVDLAHVIVRFQGYTIAHELLHYTALAVIGGRAYVRGSDSRRRRVINLSNRQKNGGMA